MIKPAEALYREYKKYKNPQQLKDHVFGGTYPESNLFVPYFALWCLGVVACIGIFIGFLAILLASPVVFGCIALGIAIVFGAPIMILLRGKHKEAKGEQ